MMKCFVSKKNRIARQRKNNKLISNLWKIKKENSSKICKAQLTNKNYKINKMKKFLLELGEEKMQDNIEFNISKDDSYQ